MKYNKLVRDKIPEIIIQKGRVPITSYASDKEYEVLLKKKLQEEVNEFLEKGSSDELVDILEVVYALSNHDGISDVELERLRKKKREERGGFEKRIILEGVED